MFYIVTSVCHLMATRDYTLVKSNEGYKLNSFNRPFHKASIAEGYDSISFHLSLYNARIAEKMLEIFKSCVVPLSLPSHHYGFTSTRDIAKWCENFQHLSQIISEKEWRWHLQIVTLVANFSANNLT